jgi:hypothetical protein
MTNIDLIDWTLQEALQLRSEEAGQRGTPSSLSRLLSVLEGNPVEPSRTEPTAQVISFRSQSTTVSFPTAGEAAAEETHTPDLPTAEITDGSPLANFPVTEKPKSPLFVAIMEPSIHTEQVLLDRAIALRWVLRDIRANRLSWSPVSQHDLRTIIDLGLVEIVRNEPVLTNAGLSAAI